MPAWYSELGKDWLPEHVQKANAGGIERVLVLKSLIKSNGMLFSLPIL